MEKRFEFMDAWYMAANLLSHQPFESNQARVDALSDLAVRLFVRYDDFHKQFLEVEAEYEAKQPDAGDDVRRSNRLALLSKFLDDIKPKL
nr:MAG TPA: hypothetical protein [Bacteriophage sp.]